MIIQNQGQSGRGPVPPTGQGANTCQARARAVSKPGPTRRPTWRSWARPPEQVSTHINCQRNRGLDSRSSPVRAPVQPTQLSRSLTDCPLPSPETQERPSPRHLGCFWKKRCGAPPWPRCGAGLLPRGQSVTGGDRGPTVLPNHGPGRHLLYGALLSHTQRRKRTAPRSCGTQPELTWGSAGEIQAFRQHRAGGCRALFWEAPQPSETRALCDKGPLPRPASSSYQAPDMH